MSGLLLGGYQTYSELLSGATGNLSLRRRAFAVVDAMPLWFAMIDVTNTKLPELAGTDPNPPRMQELRVNLEMDVVGDILHDDTDPANRWEGLEENVAYLEDNFVTPDGSVGWETTLTMPSGAERAGIMQILGFDYSGSDRTQDMFRITMKVNVPAGRLI